VMESLDGWLESLREHQYNATVMGTGEELNSHGQLVAHHYSGSIERVCEASVLLCKYQENLALELERMESVRQNHRSWSTAVNLALSTPETTPPSPQKQSIEPQGIGAQIRKWREACRWTEEVLAEKTGFHPTTVSRHESGSMKPGIKTLGAYERVFSKHLKQQIVIQNTL
jgi:ribosome-binding protein aMBF1 (putative translation factor)